MWDGTGDSPYSLSLATELDHHRKACISKRKYLRGLTCESNNISGFKSTSCWQLPSTFTIIVVSRYFRGFSSPIMHVVIIFLQFVGSDELL